MVLRFPASGIHLPMSDFIKGTFMLIERDVDIVASKWNLVPRLGPYWYASPTSTLHQYNTRWHS